MSREASASGDLLLKYPITGIAGCCACAASGEMMGAAAAPPTSVMSSRRFIAFPKLGNNRISLSTQAIKAAMFASIGDADRNHRVYHAQPGLLQRKPPGFTVSSFRELVPVHDASEEADVTVVNLAGQRILGSRVGEDFFAERSKHPD